jgi:hypothetical protein
VAHPRKSASLQQTAVFGDFIRQSIRRLDIVPKNKMVQFLHPSLKATYPPGTEPLGGYREEFAAWSTEQAIKAVTYILDQLRALGVPTPPGNRLQKSCDTIASADRFHVQLGPGDPEMEEWLVEANRTIFEQHFIVRHIVNYPQACTPTTRSNLQSMLGGQVVPVPGKYDRARDIQAELFSATVFWAAGYQVAFAEPDLIIQNENSTRLGVAVKRVTSDQQFYKRVCKARDQLAANSLSGFIVVNAARYLSQLYFADRSVDFSAALFHKVIEWLDYIDIHDPTNRVQAVIGIATSFKLARRSQGQVFEAMVHFHPRFVTKSDSESIQAIHQAVGKMVEVMKVNMCSASRV